MVGWASSSPASLDAPYRHRSTTPVLLPLPLPLPSSSLRLDLIPFSVCRDCTARGRYWGAYGSAQGDAPVHPAFLSLSLSVAIQSPVRSSYPPTLSRSLSLSLSLACTSTSGASMTSVLLLVEPFPRWPSTTFSRPLWPCTIRSARSFCAMETRETLYGRGWPEKLRETATEELLILGNAVSPRISRSVGSYPLLESRWGITWFWGWLKGTCLHRWIVCFFSFFFFLIYGIGGFVLLVERMKEFLEICGIYKGGVIG